MVGYSEHDTEHLVHQYDTHSAVDVNFMMYVLAPFKYF